MSPKAKGKDKTRAVVQVEARSLLRGRVSALRILYKNSGTWVLFSADGRSYCIDSFLGCDPA